MTILFRPQGAFGWFSYTTSRDTIDLSAIMSMFEQHCAGQWAG